MKLTPLLVEEEAKQGYTHRLDFSYRDIPAAIAVSTSKTWDLAIMPIGSIIYLGVKLLLITPFEDLSDTAQNDNTVSFGDENSATRYISAVQVNRNGTEVNNTLSTTASYLYAAAYALRLTLNSTSGKSVSDLDAGQACIFMKIGNENRPALIDSQGP